MKLTPDKIKNLCVRRLERKTINARGCIYCKNRVIARRTDLDKAGRYNILPENKSERILFCKFEECPFHQLDGLKNYLTEYDEPMARNFKLICRD